MPSSKKSEPKPSPELQLRITALHADVDADAEAWKAVGNALYKEGAFTPAIKYYTGAIERDPDSEVYRCNRSAAYLQSMLRAAASLALKDAEWCVATNPSWFKGHLRIGDALFMQEKFAAAADAFQAALSLNPACDTASASLTLCAIKLNPAPDPPSPPRPPPTTQQREPEPEARDADELIRLWSKDTDVGKRVPKSSAPLVSEDHRTVAQNYKESLLSSYRAKPGVSSDTGVKRDDFDYRTASNKLKTFSNGTDDVGNAITEDAKRGPSSW
jgi:tetratricopeptide (TPR) repeat protein